MQVAYQVLQLLADGKFHSGTYLAKKLNVCCSYIWKCVSFLRNQQVVIHAVSGRGYRWVDPMEFLNKQKIIQLLSSNASPYFSNIDLANVIPSTNDYLMQRIGHGLKKGHVCLAEGQSAGKGRLGRHWCSPYATNIYLSFYWNLNVSRHELSGLSLVIAVAVIHALHQLGPHPYGLGIKWPNDIWVHHSKLAGILIESKETEVVVGIGLNVNMPKSESLDRNWTDLKTLYGLIPSRNEVIAHLLNALEVHLHLFEQYGLSYFHEPWSRYDLLRGKTIKLHTRNLEENGVAQGINERGELCVKVGEILKAINHGEVSVTL